MPERAQMKDEKYLKVILKRLDVCKKYKPKFGQGREVSLEEFQNLYGSDVFYAWFGLNDPLMYAAHRAAGGITSVYRQIGTGCEELFRQILRDQLGLNAQQAKWSYEVKTPTGKNQELSLDGRIELADVAFKDRRRKVANWLNETANRLGVAPEIANALRGAVFEVRQGYKSKDSKRQNADISNMAAAYTQAYLPVLFLFSAQIDGDVATRYENVKCLVLRGTRKQSSQSSYAFCKEVLGCDLEAFFRKNSKVLRNAVSGVLKTPGSNGFCG